MGSRKVREGKVQDDDEIVLEGIKAKGATIPEAGEGQVAHENEDRGIIESSFFAGPLPSPEIFEQYEQICPGAADRIIAMAEIQMKHRHNLEDKFLNSRSRNSIVGIIAAFVIALCIIIVGGICILKGHSVSGTILGGMGIATLVATFLQNTKMTEDKYEHNAKDRK